MFPSAGQTEGPLNASDAVGRLVCVFRGGGGFVGGTFTCELLWSLFHPCPQTAFKEDATPTAKIVPSETGRCRQTFVCHSTETDFFFLAKHFDPRIFFGCSKEHKGWLSYICNTGEICNVYASKTHQYLSISRLDTEMGTHLVVLYCQLSPRNGVGHS